ncbi:MAG: VCBS repeat-containing protein [Ignavibacteriales bacterium]|nr:VCBS repeat-containing protein [Ignavibacteriales bacterium]
MIRTSFTGDGRPDILLISNGMPQFSLMLNRGNGSFYEEIVFGIPYAHYSIASSDVNSDGLTDIICFDSDSARYTIFWHQQTIYSDSLPATFAVGRNPNYLFVTDINEDGFDDLFVSNGGSNTVSILLGSKRSLGSQMSLETPDGPTSVTLYNKTDSSLTLITSHGDDLKIGITSIVYPSNQAMSFLGDIESYTIALAGKPSFILPDISLRNSPLSLYVFLKGQTNSIVFYQQLQSTQFIAKSLTPLIPSRIMFSTISDLNSDGYTDLVYMYNDNRTNKDLIGATLNDARGEFTGRTYTVTLPDTGHRRSFLWVEDLNSDQQKDYIFYSDPEKILYSIIAKREGEFTQLVAIADNVSLSHQNQIKFYDYDNDGVEDIIYSDSESSWVNLLRSKGNGTFFAAQRLFQLPNGSLFQCGDFDGDGTMDFVFLHTQKNTIEVRYGKTQ